jgi:hypothetical protein
LKITTDGCEAAVDYAGAHLIGARVGIWLH